MVRPPLLLVLLLAPAATDISWVTVPVVDLLEELCDAAAASAAGAGAGCGAGVGGGAGGVAGVSTTGAETCVEAGGETGGAGVVATGSDDDCSPIWANCAAIICGVTAGGFSKGAWHSRGSPNT